MNVATSLGPETSPARDDPGDETANRFRFQWTWAAVVCCMLLDETEDVLEVFCEHHEDVLLKHRDGSFTGHQVKTRGGDQPLWKAGDEAVIDACIRFAKLESEFPGQFRGYCFLTNHPLHSAGNVQDIQYVLESIKQAGSIVGLPSSVARWVTKVASGAKVNDAATFSALKKTMASADLPKLPDAVMRLVDALVQCWPPAAEYSHDAVKRSAQALIEECGRASSLHHQQLMLAYVSATVDDSNDMAARIEGKRMTRARTAMILEQGRDTAATLAGDPSLRIEPGEGSTELLHKKLDAGGFSAVSRNSAEDLRDKADYLGIVWINRYGREKGLERYNHIRSVVLSDAGRAFDATHAAGDSFGPAMRDDLRDRLRERRRCGDQLFDVTIEHLEGIAFSLTAQCKVVWSHAKPWESQ